MKNRKAKPEAIRGTFYLRGLLLCAIVSAAAPPAAASSILTPPPGDSISIPDATYALSAQAGTDVGVDGPLMTSSVPGTINSNGSNMEGSGISMVTVDAAPDPGLQIYGTTEGPFGTTSGTARVEYYFQVVPPSGTSSNNVLVPVDVTAAIDTTFIGFGPGESSTDLESNGLLQILSNDTASGTNILVSTGVCDSVVPTTTCAVFSINRVIDVFSATGSPSDPAANTVLMSGSVSGEADGNGGVATVTIDPIFSIDPAFLASNPGYSLEFSAGIGDTPSASPEPATFLLFGAGLTGLGLFRRRKKVTPHNCHKNGV